MKTKITAIIIFTLTSTIFSSNIYKKRMSEIYSRINVTLKQRLKNKYLRYPHIYKVKISLYKEKSLKCFIRLKTDSIQCIPLKSKTGAKTIAKKIKNIAKVKILKWKPYKHSTVKNYVKYVFKPSAILLTFKSGKKYYVADSHKSLFEYNYVFLPGEENKTVSGNFVLYFDKKKKAFYGTGKTTRYHSKHPVKNIAHTYTVLEYKYQKIKPDSRKAIPSFAEKPGFKMKKSKTSTHFNKVKHRWKRERLERQKRRAAERERQRKARKRRRKRKK